MSNIENLAEWFMKFEEWTQEQRKSGKLSGNPLFQMKNEWEAWMEVGLSEEELQNLEELCHTADEYSRKSFVSWLREKYSAEQLLSVLYQLVQLPLFSDWPEFEDYRIGLPEDFKRWGVRGVILREGIEGDAENVKSFLSVLVPRNPPNDNDYFEVHALNFNVTAKNALQQAGEAARQILSVRGTLYLLLLFVITGDFLLISLFEAPLIFWHTRRLWRILRNSDVGLIVDSVSGIDIAGSSLDGGDPIPIRCQTPAFVIFFVPHHQAFQISACWMRFHWERSSWRREKG
jgi:hypothetical protein